MERYTLFLLFLLTEYAHAYTGMVRLSPCSFLLYLATVLHIFISQDMPFIGGPTVCQNYTSCYSCLGGWAYNYGCTWCHATGHCLPSSNDIFNLDSRDASCLVISSETSQLSSFTAACAAPPNPYKSEGPYACFLLVRFLCLVC